MQGIDQKIDATDGQKQIDPPQYMWPVQNAYPTPGNVRGWIQNPFQGTSRSQWPASDAVYGPSKSVLQPPRGIGPQFTRSALQATTMQQKEANDKQFTTIDPALSPVVQPARSGHSSASFSFRGQHSHLGDGSCCDSTSSSMSSSGHCCICNEMSDSDLIPPRSKRHLAKSGSDKREKKFSWTTCAPVVGVAFVVASLFLLGISTRLPSHRVAFSFAVTQQVREAANEMHKETSPASDSPATSKLTEEKGNEDTAKTVLSMTAEGATKLIETSAPTVRVKTVALCLKRKHTKHALKTKSSPKGTSRKDKKSGRKERKKTRAILLQQAILPKCSHAFYTYCRRALREFFYQPDTDMCYESNGVNVCTRGTNRFATLDHCVHSCVSTTHPAGKCFGKPMFTRCARRDVMSDWWYYDHSKCVPWSFPSGGCPANGSMVFATAKECERRCRDPHHGPRCEKPDLVACGRRHLKYPYFAHMSSEDGRLRCYRSSLATLQAAPVPRW
ncbi:hypothetical protein HPB51_027782 [Rhipicephalus microplus]|uniref:Bovine pancreatic trypsin inhibitor n=1 Tax=Rhipicephalus microplus TaxID=6941 RepID=A0A9J6CYY8_RHIMP|nr:hypothetical protein HPB51_027782 [Rhipicephalus microplus]